MRNFRATPMLALGVAIVLAFFSAACGEGAGGGSGDRAGGDVGGSVRGDDGGGRTLRVGSDIPYPPFEQGNAPNYSGFDVELMEAVAQNIGREAKFIDTSFETIFSYLAYDSFEVVASAATITEEREKTVDFTNPYFLSEQAIVVKEGSAIDSVEDLKGVKVGIQQGTTGQEFVEENAEAGEIRPYAQGTDAVDAVRLGLADAIVIDKPVAENVVSAGEGLEIAAVIPTDEEYGFAVAEGEKKLLRELNEGLEEAIDDGTYARIYQKWFKRQPPKIIGRATHEAS
jgi:polar amino acid transport system substrate-binding protein